MAFGKFGHQGRRKKPGAESCGVEQGVVVAGFRSGRGGTGAAGLSSRLPALGPFWGCSGVDGWGTGQERQIYNEQASEGLTPQSLTVSTALLGALMFLSLAILR